MKWETAKQLLDQLQVPVTPKTKSGIWTNIRCPFAPWLHGSGKDSTPSFGITSDDDRRSFYKCLSCGSKGSLALLPAKLGALRNKDYSKLVAWAERAEFEETPEPDVPEWDEDIEVVNDKRHREKTPEKEEAPIFGGVMAHPYLSRRGYGPVDAVRLDLRYDEVQQRILFPVYNTLQQIVGYTGRSTMPDSAITKGSGVNPKSRDYLGLKKEEHFLLNKRWLATGKQGRIIIVEGPFDYARGVQSGYWGTMASMGTAVSDHKIEWLKRENRPVTLFFDNDTAGDAAMFGPRNRETGLRENTDQSWAERLYRHIPVWIAEYPYSAEMEGRGDPDSLTAYEFRYAVQNAWLYSGLFNLPEYKNKDSELPF